MLYGRRPIELTFLERCIVGIQERVGRNINIMKVMGGHWQMLSCASAGSRLFYEAEPGDGACWVDVGQCVCPGYPRGRLLQRGALLERNTGQTGQQY